MTTALTETTIEVAGRRLNPGVSPEWQHLLTHFELSEGFSFVVLLVPDADWAAACRIALARYLEAEGKTLQTVGFSDAEDFKLHVPGRLLDQHTDKRTGAVWLEATISEASPQHDAWVEAWRGMAARLNQFRNPLGRKLKVPLVFVGAPWIQPVIRDIAPDLWSVRTMVVRLELLEELISFGPPTDFLLEGLQIDPDLALKASRRLKEKGTYGLKVAELLHRAGVALIARFRWDEAIDALNEAVGLLRISNAPKSVLAESILRLGYCLFWQNQMDQALKYVRECQALFHQDGNALGEANCLMLIGDMAQCRFPSNEFYVVEYSTALDLFRKSKNIRGEADCIGRLGDFSYRAYKLVAARKRYEEALRLYRSIGDEVGEAMGIASLGNLALAASDLATTELLYRQALGIFRRLGPKPKEAEMLKLMGDIAAQRSNRASAEKSYQEALSICHVTKDRIAEGVCLARLGELAFENGDLAKASEFYTQALPLFEGGCQTNATQKVSERLAEIDRLLKH